MAFSFTLTDSIPATPRQIYDVWLDSRGHTAMTGSAAEASATEGGSIHGLGRLHFRTEPDAGTWAAHCAVMADNAVYRR